MVVTPGNPGMPGQAPGSHPVSITDVPPEGIEAGLFVVGPEAPLVDGLADRLRANGAMVFGPGADGAQLEGSKAFMKELLEEARVPTARFGIFDDLQAAKAFLADLPGPWVVKTDGLAAGKGVLVTQDLSEAEADVEAKLSGAAFGDAGRRVVIEEGLSGPECSLLALCDGRRVVPLPLAQDHKRAGDGDTGQNTGGMGAYSPLPFDITGDLEKLTDRVLDESVDPLVSALRRRGVDYRGVLYAGIMLTAEGPKVLEYNVRFGDPEAQVVLPRINDDLTALLAEAASGNLRTEPAIAGDAAICVVLAAEGYPGVPRAGDAIEGLDRAAVVEGVTVLHAGTRLDSKGRVVTAGGRVLGVTATGPELDVAARRAYRGVSCIGWPGMHFRKDIGAAAMSSGRERSAASDASRAEGTEQSR